MNSLNLQSMSDRWGGGLQQQQQQQIGDSPAGVPPGWRSTGMRHQWSNANCTPLPGCPYFSPHQLSGILPEACKTVIVQHTVFAGFQLVTYGISTQIRSNFIFQNTGCHASHWNPLPLLPRGAVDNCWAAQWDHRVNWCSGCQTNRVTESILYLLCTDLWLSSLD